MNPICLEQACCTFYCEGIKLMEDIQLCYCENPYEPRLICNARVFGAPNLYKLYKSREEEEEKCEEEEEDDMNKNVSNQISINKLFVFYFIFGKTKNINFGESESNLVAEILINNRIESEAQIVDFINYVYRPNSENCTDSLFKLTSVSDKTVLGVLWKYTERFNKTTALGFNQWLRKQNIDFLNQDPERKVLKSQESETVKIRARILSVLDNQFYDDVADNIVSTIPRYHAYIKQLKDDGYEVIRYCRKSKKARNKIIQGPKVLTYKNYLVNVKVLPDVDHCYTRNPIEPMLICKSRIFGAPNLYNLYKLKQVLAEETGSNDNEEDILFGKSRK
ncbi:hypothetical protein RO3G_15293 [Rhizopus delemar RA 99-880]|uniref:Uncharacterized protein n=1 Tax=Rhizopus delemar (strain RA 99-880 / ATCC MYA-4621 / FGSC 9543 / NRRL 43880) TaxID=246409 RepID=I1CQ52_RHIO9|nr:hypothetical protein RO3G_15293 [Rhizopus delemar RA 99-880]|eukprot:EIE90582.1 hypothetical protein RO3G_15293 [Rhizopus delemar RA 99-880]